MSVKEMLQEIESIKASMLTASSIETINLTVALIELQASIIHRLTRRANTKLTLVVDNTKENDTNAANAA